MGRSVLDRGWTDLTLETRDFVDLPVLETGDLALRSYAILPINRSKDLGSRVGYYPETGTCRDISISFVYPWSTARCSLDLAASRLCLLSVTEVLVASFLLRRCWLPYTSDTYASQCQP